MVSMINTRKPLSLYLPVFESTCDLTISVFGVS